MTEHRPTYGATPTDGADRCPDCGAYPAGHSALVCIQVLRWRILFIEHRVERWQRVACYFWRKRSKKEELFK